MIVMILTPIQVKMLNSTTSLCNSLRINLLLLPRVSMTSKALCHRNQWLYFWERFSQLCSAASCLNVWCVFPRVASCSWINTTARRGTKRQRWFNSTWIKKNKSNMNKQRSKRKNKRKQRGDTPYNHQDKAHIMKSNEFNEHFEWM